MNIKEKLAAMQQELKVPKTEYSRYGDYTYRTAEGILNATKPLLKKHKVLLSISDEIIMVGDRIYVKSTAILEDLEEEGGVAISGYAREELSRKKYDSSQLTGAASSYARKYALSGLFLLSDEKDPDALDPEELDHPEETIERKPRNKKKEESFMNLPEDTEEDGIPFNKAEVLDKDTYFKTNDGNFIKKKAGDEKPDNAVEITEEEFHEGVANIATEESRPKRRTRRTRS